MKLLKENDKITVDQLQQMSAKMFEKIVKAVVDVEQEIMVVDAAMHADQELFLLEELFSQQNNLWCINLVPLKFGTDGFVVFDSMINLRPGWGNFSRGVDNPAIQKKIKLIVAKFVGSL